MFRKGCRFTACSPFFFVQGNHQNLSTYRLSPSISSQNGRSALDGCHRAFRKIASAPYHSSAGTRHPKNPFSVPQAMPTPRLSPRPGQGGRWVCDRLKPREVNGIPAFYRKHRHKPLANEDLHCPLCQNCLCTRCDVLLAVGGVYMHG